MAAFVIGKHAPIPNQIAKTNPNRNTNIANGLRKGFWKLLIFSKMDPRADPRSVTMRGGPTPPRVEQDP